jgi:hypothetical protein
MQLPPRHAARPREAHLPPGGRPAAGVRWLGRLSSVVRRRSKISAWFVSASALIVALAASPSQGSDTVLKVMAVDEMGLILPGVAVTARSTFGETSAVTQVEGWALLRVASGDVYIEAQLPGFGLSGGYARVRALGRNEASITLLLGTECTLGTRFVHQPGDSWPGGMTEPGSQTIRFPE